MSTSPKDMAFTELVARLTRLEEEHARLEQVNASMAEELATLRTAQPTITEQAVAQMKERGGSESSKKQRRRRAAEQRRSRRGMLRKGLGAAAAIVGAGALLQTHTGTAYANGNEGPTVFTATGSQTAVTAKAASGQGVHAQSSSGSAIYATSSSGYGVTAVSQTTTGLYAQSNSGAGVVTISTSGEGLYAECRGSNYGIFAKSNTGVGIYSSTKDSSGNYPAIHGFAAASSGASVGVVGETNADQGTGVVGLGGPSYGFGTGVSGTGPTTGVYGTATRDGGTGVYGYVIGPTAIGVYGDGSAGGGDGVDGTSSSGTGVSGTSSSGTGIYGTSTSGLAGQFAGNVQVSGTLSKGGGSFRIDHPLDPAHKYLSHSFVESPDMMNIYNGVAILDAHGEAEVTLPTWFDALNRDFRYQLTAIGTAAPGLYIAEKISTNRFKIAGGKPGMEVSWQVTGIRQDAWANAYRIPVEQDKSPKDQGLYLHPELYGESDQKSIMKVHHPEPHVPKRPH